VRICYDETRASEAGLREALAGMGFGPAAT
jgi:hypothetical protein